MGDLRAPLGSSSLSVPTCKMGMTSLHQVTRGQAPSRCSRHVGFLPHMPGLGTASAVREAQRGVCHLSMAMQP